MRLKFILKIKGLYHKDLLHSTGKELCPVSCDSLDGRGVGGRMETCICVAESFRCSPETVTTLFIGYTQYKIKS